MSFQHKYVLGVGHPCLIRGSSTPGSPRVYGLGIATDENWSEQIDLKFPKSIFEEGSPRYRIVLEKVE